MEHVQNFNYARLGPIRNPNNYVQEAMDSYKAMQMPRWLAGKQKSLDLANQLLATKNQFMPQFAAQKLQGLGLANQAAQTQLQYLPQLMQGKLSSLGLGNELMSEKLKYMPQMMGMQQALMGAKLKSLLNPQMGRNAISPLGKLIRERTNVEHLISPDGTSQLDPSQATQLLNLYDAQMLKNTTDEVTRKRLGYANQMDITLNSMDPNAITQYSGPNGKAQLIADQLLSAQGKPPLRYQQYMKNTELAQEFAKQYRQFAADSVQPSNFKRIESLVNPSSWTNDPSTAAQMFNTLAASARTEGNNLRSQALDVSQWIQPPTTDVYGNQSPINNAGMVPAAIQGAAAPLRTSFSSQQDFQNYMSTLSPTQKQALRQQLGI